MALDAARHAGRYARLGGLLGIAAIALIPRGMAAQLSLTQEEALALAFPPPATITRRTAFLTEEQLALARRLAGPEASVDHGVVTHYVAHRDTTMLGVAYFDAHRVRTLPEVLMIVVGPDDRVRRIEVLRFAEPPEYHPPGGWLRQIEGQRLGPELSLKGDVVGITGATLTARAIVSATRRVLALHHVIRPFEP